MRASSIDTDGGEDWFRMLKAREAPVIPDPVITIDDVDGRRGVVQWFAREAGGSCQYDTVHNKKEPFSVNLALFRTAQYLKSRTNFPFSTSLYF